MVIYCYPFIIFCLPFIILWLSVLSIMDIIKSKRGRPATGRAKDGVLFLRLPKSEVQKVKEFVSEFLNGAKPKEVLSGKEDVSEFLESNDRLVKEVADLKSKIDKISRMTDDERLARWIQKHDDLAAYISKFQSDGS